MRILGAKRLSHDTDASTSSERQDEQITHTVLARQDTLVHVTEDLDVSGAVSPFDRPDLGPWLTRPELISQWDGLLVTKLDRLTRSVRDFDDLRIWCDQHNKVLISIAESLDLSTSTGRMFANLLAMFAQFERERMSERRADAAKKIYANGGYNGGQALPWGYKPVTRGGHIELLPDPDLVKLINEVADNVIGGASVRAEAQRTGIDQQTLLRRLRSPALKGIVTFKGRVVRGDDGMPIRRAHIIEPVKWDRLQARLDANARGRSVPQDAYAWLHVLKCDTCKQDLYPQRWSDRPYFYLNHKKLKRHVKEGIEPCYSRNFDGYEVEARIEPLVMLGFGDSFIPERVELPAEDHTNELAEVKESITDLRDDRYERGLFRGATGDAEYTAIMTKLETRAEVLRDTKRPARTEVVMSADLFRDRWDSLESDDERGALLRRMGVGLYARKDARGRVRLILRQRGSRWGSGRRRSSDDGPDLAEYDGDDRPGLVMDADGRISRGADGADRLGTP